MRWLSLEATASVAYKEFLHIYRDRRVLLLVLLLPPLFTLLFGHAFDTLGCKVVGLRTDNFNFASQRAIERLRHADLAQVVQQAAQAPQLLIAPALTRLQQRLLLGREALGRGDAGRGGARRLNKEWTNVNGAGL